MENQSVRVCLNNDWLREIVELHLHRQVSANALAEIIRETVFVLENALSSGQNISVSAAISEALDVSWVYV